MAPSALRHHDNVTVDLAGQLIQSIGKAKFDLWFGSAEFKLTDKNLQVSVPNRFVADWVDTRFHDTLAQIARREIGDSAGVRIDIAPPTTTPSSDQTPAPTSPATRSTGTAPLHDAQPKRQPVTAASPPARHPLAPPAIDHSDTRSLRYDLNDFVVGPSNELAYTASCRLIEEADHGMNPLFIHGGCGLGKTHLLQGLCKRYAQQHPDSQWSYTTAEQFTNEYIAAVRANRLGEFRRKLRRLDLLALDDVHFLANKNATQTEFLHTFNAMDLQGAKVVMASDAHPKQIEQFSEALVSRFVSGMVVQVHSPDAETRRQLVSTLADRRRLTITPSGMQRLIEQPVNSVRELEGLITRLGAIASLDRHRGNKAIDLPLIEQVVKPSAQPTPRPVPVERIVQTVCDQLGVERQTLMGRGRHKRVVLARSLVIYLARQLTTLSFPELARALGRRNHSTIVTATRRIEQQIKDRQPLPLIEGIDCQSVDQLASQLRRQVVASIQSLRH
ncbi:MAG: chromosomal replication initiator protein DnaA [Phycisphaeraceae bacterium]